MTRGEAEAILSEHGRRIGGETVVGSAGGRSVRVEVAADFAIASGRLRVAEGPFWEPGAVRWVYDDGAGGVSYGRWTSPAEVADWVAANADAL